MMKLFVLALLSSSVSAFVGPSSVRPATKLYENFGLDLGEDTYANQPALLGGEAQYKQWMDKINDNAFVNRQVCMYVRTRIPFV